MGSLDGCRLESRRSLKRRADLYYSYAGKTVESVTSLSMVCLRNVSQRSLRLLIGHDQRSRPAGLARTSRAS